MELQQDEFEKAILSLMNTMVDAITYDGLAERIVNEFAVLFDAELCVIWRMVQQEEKRELILSAGYGLQLKPGFGPQTYTLTDRKTPNIQIEGVTAWIATLKQTCLANSFQELARDPSKPWYGSHRGKWDNTKFTGQGDTKFKNLLGLPVLYGNDLVAVLKIESTRNPSGFSLVDQEKAERLAPFVAVALQTMEAREKHEQKRQQVIRDLTGTLLRQESAKFYQEVVDKTGELLGADMCTLWLVDKSQRKLRVSASKGIRGTQSPEYDLNWEVKDDREIHGLTPWVVIRKRPFFGERHEDLRNHPAWEGKWDGVQWDGQPAKKFGCLYAVPLLDVNNRPLGVLKIENRAGKIKFSAVDRAIFDWMADFISLAIEFNSRLRSDIVYEFFHLLKQPVSNGITAFDTLRTELERPSPRPERLRERLDMLAKNLETIRVWTINVYGLATRSENEEAITQDISLQELLEKAIENMKSLFPDFNCPIDAEEDIKISLTPLKIKQFDAIVYNLLDNSYNIPIHLAKLRRVSFGRKAKFIWKSAITVVGLKKKIF